MRNIQLNDGQILIVGNFNDAIEVIKEHFSHELGTDIADTMENVMGELESCLKEYSRLENEYMEESFRRRMLESENEVLKKKIERLERKLTNAQKLSIDEESEEYVLPFG